MVSSRLSALQQELVDAFFNEPSAFFLTGGAALAGYYLGHRFTDDLDLFSPPVESMELAVQRLRRAAAAIGATVEAVQEAPEFRRFAVHRAADVTLVDLLIDRAPQLIIDKPLLGKVRVDPEREIAANKITALLGRTAPRDLVDLFALFDRGHTLGAALADARTKDAAADPATLAWVLSQWRLGPSVPLPLGVTNSVAHPPRFERGTCGLEGHCSIQLSYGCKPDSRRLMGPLGGARLYRLRVLGSTRDC